MTKRLIVVPRWAGTPASDWYPWLRETLAAETGEVFDPVIVLDMPDPNLPRISTWVETVREALGADPAEIARTVVVGHSVGCQAVLRTLAELPDGAHVDGVLCVAGWFWTDAPWDTLMPWIETPIDLARVRAAAGREIVVLISDNDRHTADWRANRSAWQDRLCASVVLVPGANHFNGDHYPVILQTLLERFGDKETSDEHHTAERECA